MASSVSEVYATALFELAQSGADNAEMTGQVMLDLQRVLDFVYEGDGDFLKLLTSPIIPKQNKKSVLARVFGGGACSDLCYKFLCVLVDKKRFGELSGIYKAYRAKRNEHFGITDVTAILPFEADDATLERVKVQAEKLTGKTVNLEVKIDPEIIGGMILDYEGKRLDGSVKTRLEELGKKISDIVV
jgi:F-type H+-transporting ATPase subunit delta